MTISRFVVEGLKATLAVFLLILVRLIRPIVTIRFGQIHARRIGHLAGNTEYYAGVQERTPSRRCLDLFCYYEPVSNRQLLLLWSRHLNVSVLYRTLWRYNRFIPGWKHHEVSLPLNEFERVRDVLESTDTHIHFTPDEIEAGLSAMQSMGMEAGAPFVCFHVRNEEYLKQNFSDNEWGYHDFRDATTENFLLATEEMASRGYYVLRLGAAAGKPLDVHHPRIIDYASHHRTAFMDIFLLSRCRFLIGTNSGVADVADIFRTPVVRTNMTQFFAEIPLVGQKDLFITKKLHLRGENRSMGFNEILHSDLWEGRRTDQFDLASVELVENSPEEIRDAAIEMDERLKGSWIENDRDRMEQERFWRIFTDSQVVKNPVSRIGRDFLRGNPYLSDRSVVYG